MLVIRSENRHIARRSGAVTTYPCCPSTALSFLYSSVVEYSSEHGVFTRRIYSAHQDKTDSKSRDSSIADRTEIGKYLFSASETLLSLRKTVRPRKYETASGDSPSSSTAAGVLSGASVNPSSQSAETPKNSDSFVRYSVFRSRVPFSHCVIVSRRTTKPSFASSSDRSLCDNPRASRSTVIRSPTCSRNVLSIIISFLFLYPFQL